MSVRYTATLTHDASPGNPAMVGFDLGGDHDGADAVAQIVAFFVLSGAFALGTRVAGVGVSTKIAGGKFTAPVPAPYPAEKIATLIHAYNPTFDVGTGWSEMVIGETADLLPIGTSLLVSEHSTGGGRSATGRMYLPWSGLSQCDAGGLVRADLPGRVDACYRTFLMGIHTGIFTLGTVVSLAPQIVSTKLGTEFPISEPRTSRHFARLKSRTR